MRELAQRIGQQDDLAGGGFLEIFFGAPNGKSLGAHYQDMTAGSGAGPKGREHF